jgi:imidazolonepropionase-like amidohydrolase
MASSADKYGTMLLTKSQGYRALEGAANARRTLLAGFTTVRDVESEGSMYADVALRDAIERGLVEGPRMHVATRGYDAAEGAIHGTNAREIVELHDAGLSNLEAIRAATLTAADVVKLQDKIGSLEPRKYADSPTSRLSNESFS